MAIEHVNITDPNIGEPKGISTAASGQVYMANGIGSGVWTTNAPEGLDTAAAGAILRSDGAGGVTWLRDQGWGQYQDDRRTVGSPTQTLANGVRTKMICNGGFLTVERLPEDASSTSLWNTTTNIIDPVAENDVYMVRLGFSAENYAGTTPYLDLDLDIGSPINDVFWDSRGLRKGGDEQKIGFAFPVFSGSTFIANGGEIYLTYEGTGSCDIFSVDIMITRISKAYT